MYQPLSHCCLSYSAAPCDGMLNGRPVGQFYFLISEGVCVIWEFCAFFKDNWTNKFHVLATRAVHLIHSRGLALISGTHGGTLPEKRHLVAGHCDSLPLAMCSLCISLSVCVREICPFEKLKLEASQNWRGSDSKCKQAPVFPDGLYLPGPSSPPSNLMSQWTEPEKNRVGGSDYGWVCRCHESC